MQLYYTLANEPQSILLNGVSSSLTERSVTQGDVVSVSSILDISAEQSARMLRDAALADCDWVVVKASEAGEPVSDEWVTYRQALRDIPDQAGFPDNVTWPVKP